MRPRLTRRRVLGGCLLLFGVLFLGLGTWLQSSQFLILGVAWWTAALIALGILLIQRINAVMQSSVLIQSDILRLGAAQVRSEGALKSCLNQTKHLLMQLNTIQETQVTILERQGKEFGRVSSNFHQLSSNFDLISSSFDALGNQLKSGLSVEAAWRDDHSEQFMLFRGQFADFVGSVAVWMAITETEVKQSVAELVAGEASAIEAGVKSVLQRFDRVEGALSDVRQEAQQVPRAIAAKNEKIDAMARSLQAALVEMRTTERKALLDALLQRIDSVDSKLSLGGETIDAISRTVRIMLDESIEAERANMLEAEKARSDAINEGVIALREAARRGGEQMKTVSEAVDRILPAQRIEIARAKVESVKEVEAILQLQAFLAPEKPMPLLGGWAMEPVSMLRMVTELVKRQPALVLECGSGTSTLWIAKALKHIGKGRVVALEHLKEHHAATASALAAADLADIVDLHLTPLRIHRIGNEQFKWYDLKRLDLKLNSVDFLLIDGPPESTGPLARYPAVPLLERFLADHALIILDDAGRPDEIEEVTRWLKEYPAFREFGAIGERTKVFTYTSSQPSDVKRSAHLQAL